MADHYSNPKGFVGRNICYGIFYENTYYGAIVGGSATLHLAGRQKWLYDNFIPFELGGIVNNIFFHVEGPYPIRNFVNAVLNLFQDEIKIDWRNRYCEKVQCFETLVELPRQGGCYIRNKWQLVGQTKGFTCKRISGTGSDNWSGKRVWNTDKNQLRPKLVFMKKAY